MKFLDQFYICKKNIYGNKKTTISYVLLTTIISLLILTVFTLSTTISNYIKSNVDKNIEYRTMFIRYDVLNESLDSVINKISNIEHISVVLKKEQYETYVEVKKFKSSNTDGEINLIATTPDIAPPIIYGRNIKENENNVLICPINLIADSNASGRNDLYREDYINLEGYLNKYIDITYYTYDYSSEIPKRIKENVSKYKLIGLYDSNDNYTNNNVCYASISDISRINKISDGNMNEYVEGIYWSPIGIVDDSRNIEIVSKEIVELGYETLKKYEIDTEMIDNINNIIIIISIFITILAFFCIKMYLTKLLKDRKKDIGILKAIGYTNTEIKKLIIIESWILSSLSMFVSMFLYTIIYIIGLYIINYSSIIWSRFSLNYSLYGIIISFTILFIVPYICCNSIKKRIQQINPINIINNL